MAIWVCNTANRKAYWAFTARAQSDGVRQKYPAIPHTKFYVDIQMLETAFHKSDVVFLVPADSKHCGNILLKDVIC
jgi:hypothetical protein